MDCLEELEKVYVLLKRMRQQKVRFKTFEETNKSIWTEKFGRRMSNVEMFSHNSQFHVWSKPTRLPFQKHVRPSAVVRRYEDVGLF